MPKRFSELSTIAQEPSSFGYESIFTTTNEAQAAGIYLHNQQAILTGAHRKVDERITLRNALVRFPNVVITEQGSVVDANNGHRTSELPAHGIKQFPFAVTDAGQLVYKKPDRIIHIEEPASFISCHGNYASDILGELPRVSMAPSHIKLVIHGRQTAYFKGALAEISLNKEIAWVDPEVSILFKNLVYTTPTYMHHAVTERSLSALRGIKPQTLGPAPKHIYVSRSRLGSESDRFIVNECHLERELHKLGFTSIHPEELSFTEQVNHFREADAIIGPFGAAWANTAFSKPSAKKILLETKLTPEFHRMATKLGSSIDVAQCSGFKVRDGTNFSNSFNFSIEASAVEQIVCAAGDAITRNKVDV